MRKLQKINWSQIDTENVPTGQGLIDKANLSTYKSPNGTGPTVWTVTTR